jgi:hemerythrin superfamily protein
LKAHSCFDGIGRYEQLLATIKSTEIHIAAERVASIDKVAALTSEKAEAATMMEAAQQELATFKRKVASSVVNSRTGKKIPEGQIAEMLELEASKIELLRDERLRWV